jgi:serine protease Do
MKRFERVFLYSLLAIACFFLGVTSNKTGEKNVLSQQNSLDREELSFVDAASSIRSSVLGVVALKNSLEYPSKAHLSRLFGLRVEPELKKIKEMASAVVMDSSGHILTSFHTVEGATHISAAFPDGRIEELEFIGGDKFSDIAVLKLKNIQLVEPATFGNSQDLRVGEWVLAVGNPYLNFFNNADPTVTVGVISALHRNFAPKQDVYYQNMIQSDAAINPGNSGGALVNRFGEVIGINSFIYTGEEQSGSVGIGFAIPSNRVLHIAEELKTYGHRRRVYFGVDVSFSLDEDSAEGLIITGVDADSPAEIAGLVVGDRVVEVGARRIYTDNDLSGLFLTLFPNDKVEVKVERESEIITTILTLEELPSIIE